MLLGWRVKDIGGVRVDETYAPVKTVVGADSASQQRWLAPLMMSIPEVLHGLKITRDVTSIALVLEHQGSEQLVILTPLDERPILSPWNLPPAWKRIHSGALWLRDTENAFWLERLPERYALYIQINGIYPKGEESLTHFFDEAVRQAEIAGYKKLCDRSVP
jgi:hypothetical protein